MPGTLALVVTQAGFDALVDAQTGQTDAIRITQLGLSEQEVTAAPTLESLPGEFKRLDTFAGQSVSETVIHMTAQDSSTDTYELRSFGLYLDDGSLFAVYGQPDPIFRKVDIAVFLHSFDVAFGEAVQGDITFGDSVFLYPPASETVKGVAEIATQAETDAGADDERIVSPFKLAARLAPLLQFIQEEPVTRGDADTALQTLIDALRAVTITGSGLATGGGDLTANRVIGVLAATAAQVIAGSSDSVAITPASLGPIINSFGQSGYASVPGGNPGAVLLLQWGRFTAPANSSPSVTFPMAFSAPAFAVVVDGTSDTNPDAQDNFPGVRTPSITATGFTAFNANDTADECCFFAIGQVDLT